MSGCACSDSAFPVYLRSAAIDPLFLLSIECRGLGMDKPSFLHQAFCQWQCRARGIAGPIDEHSRWTVAVNFDPTQTKRRD